VGIAGLVGWRFAAPLNPELTAVAELRHRLRQEFPVDRGREEVTLVAGELATNAILHGAPPVEVQVTVADDVARVEVHDALAAWREPTKESRGILLVDAMACGWGVNYDADRGKRVWAEIPVHAVPEVQDCAPQ
jgi:anti-sigma regulatory factor (Ser/Thr protein kinase)